MADIADRAQKREEEILEAALKHRKPEGPQANGFCHNCGEHLRGKGARWCDAACRDDWEREIAK